MTSKKKVFSKAPIVSLQGQPVLLFTGQDNNLLQALERKKVKLFSQCRNGFCGACKTKINHGSVSYHREPLVKLDDDECLLCCCTPDGDIDLALSTKDADVSLTSKQNYRPTPETGELTPLPLTLINKT